jgi:hypothetical protein
MVSHHAEPDAMLAGIRRLLKKEPSEWTPEECLEVLMDYARVFLSRGKRSPGMAPLSTRYGREQAFEYVPQPLVDYHGDAGSRLRACEVIQWHPPLDITSLLLAAVSAGPIFSQPLFLLERITFSPEVHRRKRPPGHDDRQFVAVSAEVGPARSWLLEEFAEDPEVLIVILEELENIYGDHVEAGEAELREDKRSHGRLTTGLMMLKG